MKLTQEEKEELFDEICEELGRKGLVISSKERTSNVNRLVKARKLFNEEIERRRKIYKMGRDIPFYKFHQGWDEIRKIVALETGVNKSSDILEEDLERADDFACQFVRLYFEQLDVWNRVKSIEK